MTDINYMADRNLDKRRQAFDNQDRETMMDIIDDRHGKKSTIISSQIPVSAWYEIISGQGTLADAILDRIVNSSHRIDLKAAAARGNHLEKESSNENNNNFFISLYDLLKWYGLTEITRMAPPNYPQRSQCCED